MKKIIILLNIKFLSEYLMNNTLKCAFEQNIYRNFKKTSLSHVFFLSYKHLTWEILHSE